MSDQMEVSEDDFNKCIPKLGSLLYGLDLKPLSKDVGVRTGRLSSSSCRTQYRFSLVGLVCVCARMAYFKSDLHCTPVTAL